MLLIDRKHGERKACDGCHRVRVEIRPGESLCDGSPLFPIEHRTQERPTAAERNHPVKEGCPTRAPPARGRTVAHRWLFWANPTFVASAQWRAFLGMAFIPISAPTLSAANNPGVESVAQ